MPDRGPLSTAAAAQIAAMRDLVARMISTSPDVTRIRPATVTSVVGTGNTSHIVVNYAGSDVPAARLASYTPAVGDVVALSLTGGSPLILGRIVSTPS